MEQIVFAQVTDLHIGRQLIGNVVKRGLRGGYNTHDPELLKSVSAALDEARVLTGMGADEPWRVVMGGDLTAGGTGNDYALARGLLLRRWPLDRAAGAEEMGFEFDEASVLAVPGNHDHWGTNYVQYAYRPDLFPRYFEPTPWAAAWSSQNGRLRLELYGVDSNSGLAGQRLNVYAVGRLHRREKIGLRYRLMRDDRRPPPGVIRTRAFVCHHAFTQRPRTSPKPLERPDIRFLCRMAARYRVSAVLTGHTHRFEHHDHADPGGPNPNWRLHEFCCASATAGPGGPQRNGFWVHRLALEDESAVPVWRTWRFQTGAELDFDVDDADGQVVTLSR